ncbi:MAG: hypothetical protein ACLGHY_05405, partial [Gammaproteobacteria bacterium]
LRIGDHRGGRSGRSRPVVGRRGQRPAGACSADDFARLVAIQELRGSVLLDPGWWRLAVARADADAWQQAWQHLDTLIERLAAAGQTIGTIVLTGERDLVEFSPHADDRWALWRRRRLDALLAAHR